MRGASCQMVGYFAAVARRSVNSRRVHSMTALTDRFVVISPAAARGQRGHAADSLPGQPGALSDQN